MGDFAVKGVHAASQSAVGFCHSKDLMECKMKLWKVMSLTILFTATAVGQPVIRTGDDQVTGADAIDSTVTLHLDESGATTNSGAKGDP